MFTLLDSRGKDGMLWTEWQEGKIAPAINYLSTTPWGCMGECRCSCIVLNLGTGTLSLRTEKLSGSQGWPGPALSYPSWSTLHFCMDCRKKALCRSTAE
jgi:hypothetical protein